MTAPRVFADHEIAARLWFYLSPFKDERALAALRFRAMTAHVDDANVLLQVIGEMALDGFHAKAIIPRIVVPRATQVRQNLPANPLMAARVAALIAGLAAKLRAPAAPR